MLFYIQKFCYNSVGKAMCFTFKSSFLAFHCHSGTFALLQNKAFSNFRSTMNDSCGFVLKNWESWCERPFLLWDESSSLPFQQPDTWQGEYKWIRLCKLSSTVISLQTLLCAHQFLLDGYFLFGIEENPLTAFNSALLRGYLFLFYFSR